MSHLIRLLIVGVLLATSTAYAQDSILQRRQLRELQEQIDELKHEQAVARSRLEAERWIAEIRAEEQRFRELEQLREEIRREREERMRLQRAGPR